MSEQISHHPQAPAAAFDRRAIPSEAAIDHIHAPDGWLLRRIRFPVSDAGKARGSILFVGGRGDHFEKYLETLAGWHQFGWQVESVDWRGQGGSGRVIADRHVGDISDFSIWIDDISAVTAEWQQRTPGPHVIIAHSMGGHLILRTLAEQRIAPDAAVLVAPMLGFTAPYPDAMGLWVAKTMTAIGKPERAAWKVSEKPGSPMPLRLSLLTHDPDRYRDELWWQEKDPALQLGPASWRWVREAYRSFIALAKPGVLETIRTPVLVLAASADKLVSTAAIRRDAARIASATLHVYGPEAAHELLREADRVRDDALARIDRFLMAVAAPQ